MHRHFALASLALLLIGGSARGSLMLTLEGLPAAYQPNSSFSFDVRLVGAVGLNSFSIELIMQADQGTAGVDFFFDEDLTVQPDSRYVFDPGLNPVNPVEFFSLASTDDFNNTAIIALSDFLDDGEEVDTIADVNDLIATVTVTTTGDVGKLSIGFDTDFLLLDDASFGLIDGFDDLVDALEASGPISVNPASVADVPEPSTLTIFLLGTAVTVLGPALRRRRRVRCEGASASPLGTSLR